MNFLTLTTSLAPSSRSRILARRFHEQFQSDGHDVQWLDVADMELPICDGHAAWDHEHAVQLKAAIEQADGIALAFGIYNYSASAIAKTVLELGGKSWSDKVVGFVCAAGGQGSYMAAMSLVNSLMLDFRCVIVPRFVYATGSAFDDGQLVDDDVAERLGEMAKELARMTKALRTS